MLAGLGAARARGELFSGIWDSAELEPGAPPVSPGRDRWPWKDDLVHCSLGLDTRQLQDVTVVMAAAAT
ncbi:MAG: hypothetical protein JWR63_2315 [Conexibacter sp.]|nr:hypothetical protein [Conexibacter sp.]MCW2996925.1 hypothetical protein [Solirubrobacterales bacterium]